MSIPSVGSIVSYPIRFMLAKQFWRSSAFLATSFPLGVLWFTTITSLASLGGNLIVGIGILLLFLTLLLVKVAAGIERGRLALLLDISIPAPYRPLPTGGWWPRALALVSDPALWRDLLYLLLLSFWGSLEIVVLLLAFIVPLGMLLMPVGYQLMPGIQKRFDIQIMNFSPINSEVKVILIAGIGLLWFLLVPRLIIPMARWHGAFAQRLLGISLSARMAALTESRTQVLKAALTERQRIERDLHDGAQQHLLALAMDLGMAKEKWETEPETVHALILMAHEQAKRSLAELRDLVRGIYPAVLTDRGLDAALSALASRSPVPITVTVRLPDRLPELVESTAYFVVAEALTNIAKHSDASQAAVSLFKERNNLIIEITDNGYGGATMTPGTGLAGLRDRLVALDGSLTLSSPPGGPTHLRGVIPCV